MASLNQILARLRPLFTVAWAHRAQFQAFMNKPGWHRVFQGVSILSFGIAVTVYYQQQDFISCIAAYNDAQARSGAARAQAIDASLTAIDNSIHTVATATTREQVRKALADYEAAREAAKKQRAENPFPAPPSERCD